MSAIDLDKYREFIVSKRRVDPATGIEVEVGDALIILLGFCGAMQIDIGAVVAEKMAYNSRRADHKLENRRAVGGKKF